MALELMERQVKDDWKCSKCGKYNYFYAHKMGMTKRTTCWDPRCKAPKESVKVGSMTDRITEITEQVKKAMHKQEELHEIVQEIHIAQLRQQLAAKESAGTNLGAVAVEKVQVTKNQLANLQGPNAGANGSGVMANMTEPRNGRYPLIKLHNGDTYEGEFLNGAKHGHGIYTWSDGTRYEGEYRSGVKHGRGIETLSDGSRHKVEFRNGKMVKSAKEIPCAIDVEQLPSAVIGFVIFVVLSLIVYFGISFFYFILTTTAGSVSKKMGPTLERGTAHVLAAVRLSSGAIDQQGTEHGKTPLQMDFKGKKETKESSQQERRPHISPLLEEVYRMMKETRAEVQQLNQRHKQADETRLNQDIQIAILRQEIKSLKTNATVLEETQSTVYTELSGDKSRNGENSSTEHTPVRTLQSPLTRGAPAGTHHNVTAREPHRAFTNDPPVINGGGLKSDGKLHKRLKSVRCKILKES